MDPLCPITPLHPFFHSHLCLFIHCGIVSPHTIPDWISSQHKKIQSNFQCFSCPWICMHQMQIESGISCLKINQSETIYGTTKSSLPACFSSSKLRCIPLIFLWKVQSNQGNLISINIYTSSENCNAMTATVHSKGKPRKKRHIFFWALPKGSPHKNVATSIWALPVWRGGSRPLPGWFGALI